MKTFEVRVDEETILKGKDFSIENPKAYLVGITGMNEHSGRYERFAHELNEESISVFWFDHFGQGENAESIERQEIWPKDAWKKMLKALNLKVTELKEKGLPVYLMGHSMGSFAMQSYLETYPNTVDRIVIMGTNGPNGKLSFVMGNLLSKITTNDKNWEKEDKLIASLSVGAYTKAVKNRRTDLDWLAYNNQDVDDYIKDPYCGHFNTHSFFRGFMSGLASLYKKKNLKKISKDEHILLVAGKEDPVGANGKGPQKLFDLYKRLGVKDVSIKLYDKMRHEILNEVDRDIVVKDIKEFLNK